MSTRAYDFVIDALAVGMPHPIRALLADPKRTIVLHGADYDVRSLKRAFGLELGKIFDTLIAASFLNKKQLGLKSLLETELGVAISKTEQRSDWGKRPLTENQIAYARQDTAHLIELAARLEGELAAKDRLAWMEEECDRLKKVEPSEKIFDREAWKKLKGARQLAPPQRRALEAAYLWRERTAEARDRPPFRILNNESLVKLAETIDGEGVVDVARAKRARVLPPASDDRASLLEAVAAIAAIAALPEARHEENTVGARAYAVDPVVKQRLDRLKLARVEWSKVLDLDPGFLIAQSVLERLARDPPADLEALSAISGMTRWRSVAIGDGILDALRRDG
jgi:ribonuclease D